MSVFCRLRSLGRCLLIRGCTHKISPLPPRAHTSNVEFLSSCFIQGSCVFVSWGIEPTLEAPFKGLSIKLFYLRWFCPGFVEELVLSPIDAFHGFGSAAPHLSMNKYHVVRLGVSLPLLPSRYGVLKKYVQRYCEQHLVLVMGSNFHALVQQSVAR